MTTTTTNTAIPTDIAKMSFEEALVNSKSW